MKRIRSYFGNICPLAVPASAIALTLYFFSRVKDSDALRWILAPTAWWVSILGKIPFEYVNHQGYVNHYHQFLIAPSCAGVRFMLITFLMLVFSQKICAIPKGHLRVGFCLVFSYLSTVFVNGIRIVLAIYLPGILEKGNLMERWLTPDRLHTLIGTVTYFISLCMIYPVVLSLCRPVAKELRKKRMRVWQESTQAGICPGAGAAVGMAGKDRWLVPAFWYLLIVLVLPFAKRIYDRDLEGFAQYAFVVIAVCGSVCAVMAAAGGLRKRRIKVIAENTIRKLKKPTEPENRYKINKMNNLF